MSRTVEILERLIAFPTVSKDSNLDLIHFVQDLLQSAGFAVVRIPSPCGQKAGLFARLGPELGGVCLSAHTDVVPIDGQEWPSDPFTLTQHRDRLHGRGVTDMKGFLASALAMAERAARAPLTEPLSLAISYDEEIGCVGIRQMMPTLAPLLGSPRAVIVGEPTSMQVATGHKGKVALKVTCHGEAGHSALAPDFTNALHVASTFIDEVRALQVRLAGGATDLAYSIPYSTVHIGRMSGGRALNIVPDSAELEMEFRHLAQTPASEILSELNEIAQRVGTAFGNPNAAEITQTNAYYGLDTSVDDPVVSWASQMANSKETTKVAFGTEAGFFAAEGIPTVVIGPGDMARDGHKADEGVDLSELAACDAMMDRILTDLSA
ncbi:acetylornithine deacetylase [Aliiroseovarius sp. S253]|uniref:acetylornithine deacetylase n=1 Tax=Aliiroseovarius sp. S253 TaxID=3415133 RepID=UPI003C7B6FF3